ncbi:MAG: hypothetical protein PQJ61_03160 [Spirochaetales bacterium]|uniref:Uncharacterized protein n=1 Tax=Candidatus Thalassospirochaeta sargassi TaxID=3119039 RepID=A0AAJ1IDF0_9SPIO|nr:hypothetical protein [Spirochaetales bacterium]
MQRLKFVNKILFTALIFIITAPLEMSAEGITILKHKNSTELLTDWSGIEKPENSVIRLTLSGSGSILLKNDENTDKLRFSTGAAPVTVDLHNSMTGLIPHSITLDGSSFDLLSAEISPEKNEAGVQQADIGHIIFSEFAAAGGKPWNVYSWNLIPEVLIFDTADYETQARLFKRLAFFVEKPGYTGRLVPNEELEGKHGWNAHDYRPEDLAEFFNKAAETGFSLNTEEVMLKEHLLSHGIILSDGELYSAGKGAVLSVSRETLPNWRYRFLTHECLHGLFFTNEDYRDDMFEAFDSLSSDEIEFWKHLLDYRNYDVENKYLLVNEHMAYSLQQPVEEIDEYFKGFLYKKMIAARPWENEFVAEFEKNNSTSFRSTVSKLEKILYNYTGRLSGHLANLYPIEIDEQFYNLFPPI